MRHKEVLIKKWLDNDLSHEELVDFKSQEEYAFLTKLTESAQYFKNKEYNTSEELDNLLAVIKTKKQKYSSRNWLKPFLRIAAVFVLGFFVYYFSSTQNTTIDTLASQKTTIALPDQSTVTLNAVSTLKYNKSKWTKNREVILDGEAYFKVAKGSDFKVKTTDGIVTVLGTEFNIKQRPHYFEVTCFEGLVSVAYNSQVHELGPTENMLVINGDISNNKKDLKSPLWLENKSSFKSMPYRLVLEEFERQYNVIIKTENIDTSKLFTGHFDHNNIELAIKAISLPFHLTYSKTDHVLLLKNE